MLIARCSLFCCSCRARRVHAIRIQHVVQSYDPFQLMNIGPIDYRQNVYVGFAHALQREIQGMVSMDMGKVQGVQKINQILFAFLSARALSILARLRTPTMLPSSTKGQALNSLDRVRSSAS